MGIDQYPREFNRHDDHISDPGAEDAMGADGAPYHFGQGIGRLVSGDVRGAIETIPVAVGSGVRAARRILGTQPANETAVEKKARDVRSGHATRDPIDEGGPLRDA